MLSNEITKITFTTTTTQFYGWPPQKQSNATVLNSVEGFTYSTYTIKGHGRRNFFKKKKHVKTITEWLTSTIHLKACDCVHGEKKKLYSIVNLRMSTLMIKPTNRPTSQDHTAVHERL